MAADNLLGGIGDSCVMENETAEERAQHWKTKHRELLREIAKEETAWRDLERLLRRLVTRLCIAANGHDPRLDSELTQLAGAIKRDGRCSGAGVPARITQQRHDGAARRQGCHQHGPGHDPAGQPEVATVALPEPAESSHSAIVAALADIAAATQSCRRTRGRGGGAAWPSCPRPIRTRDWRASSNGPPTWFATAATSSRANACRRPHLLTEVTNRLNEVAAIIASGDSDLSASRLGRRIDANPGPVRRAAAV